MNSRERVLAALQHKEPDMIPFDIGGAPNTGIHIIAYRRLLKYLGYDIEAKLGDVIFQSALIDEEILQHLKVDLRGLDFCIFGSESIQKELKEDEKYFFFTGDWKIKWVMPKINGFYYDMRQHPLSGSIDPGQVDELDVPGLPSQEEIDSFKNKAKTYRKRGLAVVLAGPDGGILEHAFAIRGHEDFMVDMVSQPGLAKKLLDKILAYKLEYWELMLREMGELVDIVSEGDDMATQKGLIINPRLYRSMLKPLHRELFSFIRKNAPKPLFINFHSCGSIKELIPDFIEIGINSLHPVQVSAWGMDTKKLKKEFGRDLAFWGGGVDTQHVLSQGTPKQVREEVKRRIDDLAPGGGYIFAAVHNIQADVPPENIMAMWEAFNQYRNYS
ncbi:MAG: uroporphyrinogen decarboxylase family protein [Actinomycetota bacterium]